MKLLIFFGLCIIGIIVDATPLKWHDTVKIHQKKDAKDASKEGKIHDIYEVNEEHHLLERGDHVGQGDILFKEGEEEAWFGDEKSGGNVKRDGIRNTRQRWPNGVVPYVIAQANTAARNAIAAAAAEYKAKTCIKLVPRTNQKDYIRIIAGAGCYSYVGKTGGMQDLSLGRGCEYKSTAIHEFMHALGFFS